MSGKQQAQQESKPKVDKKPGSREPASGEYVTQVEPLGLSTQAGRLPDQPSNRHLRQASVIRMQRRLGNAYVQRFLTRNGKPATIQKSISGIGRDEVITTNHPSSNTEGGVGTENAGGTTNSE